MKNNSKKSVPNNKLYEGFTLIELLIVIAILAVLATTVTLVLNPTELIKQARDSTRLSDLRTLDSALAIHLTDTGGTNTYGSSSVVYISLADSTTTCANHTLPSLPSGWSYNCVTEENLTNTDSTGWIPVDFTSMSISSPLSRLPIDPVNSDTNGLYYSYVSGSWELNGIVESKKNREDNNIHKKNFPGVISIGINTSLSPIYSSESLIAFWSMDNESLLDGGVVHDESDNNNSGTLNTNDGNNKSVKGKIGNALHFDGSNDWVNLSSLGNFDNASISLWFNKYDEEGTKYIMDGRGSGGGSWWLLTHYGGYDINFYNKVKYNGISPNTWYHLVVTFNSENSEMYLNGKLVSSSSGVSPVFETIRLGTRYTNSGYLNGKIDEFRVYNKILSEAEIKAIYDSTK